MPIIERSETFPYDIEIRNNSGTLISPPSVLITIINSCGETLVDDVAMVTDGTGLFSYGYNVPATARYGAYDVIVSTISDGTTTKYNSDFVVYQYNLIRRARRVSGVGKPSLSDDEVAGIGIEALREALDDVYEYRGWEQGQCDPNYNVMFNGTNTTIRTCATPIADYDFDGVVQGNGQIGNCSDWVDIRGYWINSTYAKYEAYVDVVDKDTGRITVTQTTGAAIPSTHKGVFLEYHVGWESFNIKLFEEAVAYLTSHYMILRMTDLHHATTADLASNVRKIDLNLDRFLQRYLKILDMIAKPRCDGI